MAPLRENPNPPARGFFDRLEGFFIHEPVNLASQVVKVALSYWPKARLEGETAHRHYRPCPQFQKTWEAFLKQYRRDSSNNDPTSDLQRALPAFLRWCGEDVSSSGFCPDCLAITAELVVEDIQTEKSAGLESESPRPVSAESFSASKARKSKKLKRQSRRRRQRERKKQDRGNAAEFENTTSDNEAPGHVPDHISHQVIDSSVQSSSLEPSTNGGKKRHKHGPTEQSVEISRDLNEAPGANLLRDMHRVTYELYLSLTWLGRNNPGAESRWSRLFITDKTDNARLSAPELQRFYTSFNPGHIDIFRNHERKLEKMRSSWSAAGDDDSLASECAESMRKIVAILEARVQRDM